MPALGAEKLKDTCYGGLTEVSTIVGTKNRIIFPAVNVPGAFAMMANRYFSKYGMTVEQGKGVLAKISVNSHTNSAKNPKAHLRWVITEEDVLRAPIYCISKAGVWILTRALELAHYNIRLDALTPCCVKTDMNIQFRPDHETEKQIASGIPLGRLGEPEDISRVALYLVSEASDYITGQSIVVDGGINDTVYAKAFSE